MSAKTKFLNIITFGHLSRKAKKEAAKKAAEKAKELTVNTVDLPDVVALVNALGGSANIGNITNTISTITLAIEDFNKVDNEHLAKIIKHGVAKSPTSITLIVGDCAKLLNEKITEYKQK